jgi:LmbE family N-acetylglucosaminyl deacetylase
MRVLVIGAHPDDEDTRLIAWLRRGRQVETAYLSLTRGDGGQNLIGNELGEALGVIRTEELLAARRVDGATQYFARAYDFGFSKSADEAYGHWPHDTLLGDVVRVVRAFRPHVIVAVFTGTPRDGHGQHQVSGLLAREAWDAAGDTTRFPPGTFGAAWTPAKFYRNTSYLRGEGKTLEYNAGEYAALLGRSYAEIAGESRSQHRSQAFGVLQPKGVSLGSVRREASRVNEAAPASTERTLFDGIDTTWARLAPAMRCGPARAALDSLAGAIAATRARLDLFDPAPAVPLLATVRRLARTAAGDATEGCRVRDADAEQSLRVLTDRVTRALIDALGLVAEAIVPRDVLADGDSITATVTVYNRGRLTVMARGVSNSPPAADAVGGSSGRGSPVAAGAPAVGIAPDSSYRTTATVRGAGTTGPWWLARPRRGDFLLAQTRLPVESEQALSPFPQVTVVIEAAGETIPLTAPVVFRFADPVRGELNRPLSEVPAVSITLDREVALVRANAPIAFPVRVTLRTASTEARAVTVALRLPAGLSADSATRAATVPDYRSVRTVEFLVRGRLAPGRSRIAAVATTDGGGHSYARGYVPIEYEHIRPARLYRESALDVEAVDVALPATLNVAYVQGVGDNVAPILRELGVPVTVLEPTTLGTADLSSYTAIVVGTRAYEAQPELVTHNGRLLDYARAGGTLVVQYGQYEVTQPGIMPYPITLGRPAQRVTDEAAPVRIVDSTARVLTTPNRITERDFTAWVQDRTLYMPATHAPEYAAPLSVNDPGEPPNDGAILVAPLGNGLYVYTTLAFFRQLPAGNPGAARLFINLISSGRKRGPMSARPGAEREVGR